MSLSLSIYIYIHIYLYIHALCVLFLYHMQITIKWVRYICPSGRTYQCKWSHTDHNRSYYLVMNTFIGGLYVRNHMEQCKWGWQGLFELKNHFFPSISHAPALYILFYQKIVIDATCKFIWKQNLQVPF